MGESFRDRYRESVTAAAQFDTYFYAANRGKSQYAGFQLAANQLKIISRGPLHATTAMIHHCGMTLRTYEAKR